MIAPQAGGLLGDAYTFLTHFPAYAVLDVALLGSELALVLSRHSTQSKHENASADRGSLRILWIVILVSITLAHMIAARTVGPLLRPIWAWKLIGITVFIFGLVFRHWSIRHLGRLFTVDVAVATDHHIVDDGPFRYVRHPTYSGLLLEFAGIGFTLCSLSAWLVMMVPIFFVLLHRARIEEQALVGALGEPYAAYILRTKRFVPWIV